MELNSTNSKVFELLKYGLSSKLDIVQSDSISLFEDNSLMCANEDIIIIRPGSDDENNLLRIGIEGSVKGKPLFEFLARNKGKTLKYKYDEKKNEIVLTGKGRAGFRVEDLDGGKGALFDQIYDVMQPDNWIDFDSNEFVKALSIVYSCASDDPKMGILGNIYFENGMFEACDQFRYATTQSDIEVEDSIFIPKKAACVIMDMKPSHYCVGDFWVVFYSSEYNIITAFKNIDEQWPDFENIKKNVKKSTKKGMKIKFSTEMSELLKESFIFSKRDSEESDMVHIELGKDLSISSKNEYGWFTRSTKNENPPKTEITFNIDPNMMIQYLAISDEAVVSGERIVMMGDDFMYFVNLERT